MKRIFIGVLCALGLSQVSSCSLIVENKLSYPEFLTVELDGTTEQKVFEYFNIVPKILTTRDYRIPYFVGDAAKVDDDFSIPYLELKFTHNKADGSKTVKTFNFTGKHCREDAAKATGTVLLLHGYGASIETLLHDNIAFQCKGYNTINYELLGHGRNNEAPVSFGPQDIKRIHALLTESDNVARPIYLYGKSYGASVAAQYIQRYGNVDGLIAVAPMTDFNQSLLKLMDRQGNFWTDLLDKDWLLETVGALLADKGVTSQAIATPLIIQETSGQKLPNILILSSPEDKISDYSTVSQLRTVPKLTLNDELERIHVQMMIFDDQLDALISEWLTAQTENAELAP